MTTPHCIARLYFGLAIPDGGLVSQEAFEAFVSDRVSVAFPEGFTVFDATGGWQDTQTGVTIREPSKVLEVVYPFWSNANREALRAVAAAYKDRFQQQAVLLVEVPAHMEVL